MEPLVNFAVTKKEGLDAAPDSAKSKPHHVLRPDGSTAMFRNPHPSFVDGVGVAGSLGFLGFFKMIGVFIR